MKQEKINTANIILKDYLEKNFCKESWVYIDFVLEDRFVSSITEDNNISIVEMTAQELADYAIENIEASASRSRLMGF